MLASIGRFAEASLRNRLQKIPDNERARTLMTENIVHWKHRAEATALEDRLARPLRDLRISVMDRCNFRCPYCMPEDKYHKDFQFLPSSERLSFQEIIRLVRIFAGLDIPTLG